MVIYKSVICSNIPKWSFFFDQSLQFDDSFSARSLTHTQEVKNMQQEPALLAAETDAHETKTNMLSIEHFYLLS